MKQKVIGTFYAGNEQIQLVLREGDGGEFWFCPEDGSLPRIKVGADYNDWYKVVAILLHEIDEFVLDRMGCRFNPTNLIPPLDNGAYTFHFTHTQLTEKCVRVADFMAAALPPLAKEWKRWKKKG